MGSFTHGGVKSYSGHTSLPHKLSSFHKSVRHCDEMSVDDETFLSSVMQRGQYFSTIDQRESSLLVSA